MTAYVESRRRRLPRGWKHFALQFAFWIGFYVVYQMVRGVADRNPLTAFWNGFQVIDLERRTGALFEPTVQRVVDSSSLLIAATSYTYWLSQFAVVGASLLWIYFRHQERFARFRNWLILANLVGLACYVLVPTAPPRMFPEWGFADTLAEHSSVNHESGLIAFAANPYAAMPSLHAMDAFIVGVVMAAACRTWWMRTIWLLWPAWVAFAVIGTGNHYWLDVVAGVAIAVATGAVVYRRFPLLRGRRTAEA